MLRLVIEDDEGKTTVVPLIRDELTIGRKEGNTIRLTERNVSRRHARLSRTGDSEHPTVIVEDLDSYNGVRLNGNRIAGQCTLTPGDLLQIGDYALAVRIDGPADGAQDNGLVAPSAGAATPDLLPPDMRARLVVISSNLAGEIFWLDRNELIIGRTDENDVVVNHRSISRNHAKVLFREDAFTLIDLASSNGMRINGEAFGTANLVNGDVVELGHVKLRYVAPGDDYVFNTDDVDDVDVPATGGAGRTLLVLLLLAAVAGGAFWWMQTQRKVTSSTGRAATEASAKTPKATEPTIDLQALLAEGHGHLKAERWDLATKVFDRILQAKPTHPEASDLKALAMGEARSKVAYAAFLGDIQDEQWQDAFFALDDFPENSRYAEQIATLKPRVQSGFAKDEFERGRRLLNSKDLKGAQGVQSSLAKRDFAKREANTLQALIKRASRPTPASPAVHVARRPARPSTPPAIAPAGPTYEALLVEAQKLIIKGDRAAASARYFQALKIRPGALAPHQSLCVILEKLDKPKKALHHCKKWLYKESNQSQKAKIKQRIERMQAQFEP